MNMFSWLRSRYTAIVVFIGLFLVFDMSVLVLDTYVTAEIEHDAAAVNMAGRQRMLSQRTSKLVFQIQNDELKNLNHDASLAELRTTVNLFDTTLNAFTRGGVVSGGKGEPVELQMVESEEGKNILADAAIIWNPLNILLDPFMSPSAVMPTDDLIELSHYIRENNLKLLKLMNDLTSEREASAASKAEELRTIQLVAMVLSTINFGFILFYFIRKLRQSDEQSRQYSENLVNVNNELASTHDQLVQAKGQTDEILGTVGEGLFLIDENGYIGDEYSRKMETIFPGKILGGVKFLDLMKPIVSEKAWGQTTDYLTLLFQKRLKEKMLINVNPLDQVDAVIDSGENSATNKILSFRFNRVFDVDKNIRHILVTVQDMTEQIALERQLDEQKEYAKQQIEMMYSTIKVEPLALKRFLTETAVRLDSINEKLKSAQKDKGDLRMVVEHIFRDVHTLKGDAGILGLELFEQAGHRIEDELVHLREYPKLSGEHFVKFTLGLDELRSHLAETVDLVERMSAFRALDNLNSAISTNPANINNSSKGESSVEASNASSTGFIQDITAMASKIAREKGCEIAIDSTYFDSELIPSIHMGKFKDLLVQLVRNAVVHGIEVPQERQQKLKPTTGILKLATEVGVGNSVELIVRDDGRGIDLNAIREKALRNGLRTRDQLAGMDNNGLATLIFEPGFSTADTVDLRAGRGVGMDIVKEKVREMGGKLRLAYAPNRFSEFRISLPISITAA